MTATPFQTASRPVHTLVGLALVILMGLATVGAYIVSRATEAGAANRGTTLASGQRLVRGDQLVSANGRCRLILQGDQNLVLYEGGRALWSSGTVGSGADRAVMQGDGNLVLYRGSQAVWHTHTNGNHGARLSLQVDCNLVVYQGSTPKWHTHTGQASGPSSGTSDAGTGSSSTPATGLPWAGAPFPSHVGLVEVDASAYCVHRADELSNEVFTYHFDRLTETSNGPGCRWFIVTNEFVAHLFWSERIDFPRLCTWYAGPGESFIARNNNRYCTWSKPHGPAQQADGRLNY